MQATRHTSQKVIPAHTEIDTLVYRLCIKSSSYIVVIELLIFMGLCFRNLKKTKNKHYLFTNLFIYF